MGRQPGKPRCLAQRRRGPVESRRRAAVNERGVQRAEQQLKPGHADSLDPAGVKHDGPTAAGTVLEIGGDHPGGEAVENGGKN
ncbi:hypothetical protein GGQ80_003384 [Sphingomonas jinjuensis]|uniref:Uncharacterized protein n=1 Tax=Sphingomonas jinjuensis TaxID=535907 RepID=A0A840FF23_9SPHN|nr:hypothetical protein [Sphingomonas jinjuensis]